jgi:hypothetical protein
LLGYSFLPVIIFGSCLRTGGFAHETTMQPRPAHWEEGFIGRLPSFQLPWSRKVSANWTAAGMLSIYVPTIGGSHRVVGESTLLMDRQLTKAWDAFAEYAGDFPQAGGPRHLLHFGTAYKIRPQQQLDFHVGVGLSAAAVDHFVGIGYSFCFRMAGR